MGRIAKGWTLRPRGKSGTLYVRFVHEGKRIEESTGTRDPDEAARRADETFAAYVTGRRRSVAERISPRLPLDELAAKWIASLDSTHSQRSIGLYMSHLRRHILPFFGALDRISTATIAQYQREGLRRVLRTTVRTELKTLRGFLAWCKEQEIVSTLPDWPRLPRTATGVRDERRRRGAVGASPEQIARFIAALPEWSCGRSGRHRPFLVRPRFAFAWETGLRPGTIDRLSVPEHWTPTAPDELTIADEIDKAKFGRKLPLSKRAREILEAYAPTSGPIFGAHDVRPYVRAAAEETSMPRGFSAYDLRHGRATQLVEGTGNLVGVGYLLGHKRVTTTAVYVHGSRRAAESVLDLGGADSGASAELVARNSGEPSASGDGRLNPWERSDRKNRGILRGDRPQKAAENVGEPLSSGAVPHELEGLVSGVVWCSVELDAAEATLADDERQP